MGCTTGWITREWSAGCSRGAFGEGLRDPVAYLMMNDPDRTTDTEAQIRSMPGMVTVGWHRGHPKRRKPDRRDWTEHDTAIFEVDAIAGEYAGVADGVRTDCCEFAHKPRFSVWWRGELLHGHLSPEEAAGCDLCGAHS